MLSKLAFKNCFNEGKTTIKSLYLNEYYVEVLFKLHVLQLFPFISLL